MRNAPRTALVIAMGAALVLGAVQAQAACVGGVPNGVEQTGEDCDFGPDPNDCCSDSCTFVAVGTACDDYDICSINTTCDSEGQCSGSPDPTKPAGTDCDDHNDCTTSDDCNSLGHCVGGAGQTGEQCRVRDVAGNFTDCKTRICQGKACTGAIVGDPCDDGNSCTTDTCTDPATSSCDPVHPAIPVGGSCNTDENNCTVETCHDDDLDGITTCQLDTTISCSDPNPDDCKVPSCNPTTTACDIITKKQKGSPCLNDGNICTVDQCSATGKCTHPAVSIPTACNDGNSCTANDMCSGKNCAPGPALANGSACSDDNVFCTVDYCNNGVCAHAATNPFTTETTNGLSCTDNNPCTTASACSNGSCLGTSCATAPAVCTNSCGSPACGGSPPLCNCGG